MSPEQIEDGWQQKIADTLINPSSLNPRLSETTCAGLMAGLDAVRSKRPTTAKAFVGSLEESPVPNSVSRTQQVTGRVFISYSHADMRWLKKLETVVTPLVRENRFATFVGSSSS